MYIHNMCPVLCLLLMKIICMIITRTVGELKDWTKRNLWCKTTLNTSGMRGARADPPTCKMGTFFLCPCSFFVQSLRLSHSHPFN